MCLPHKSGRSRINYVLCDKKVVESGDRQIVEKVPLKKKKDIKNEVPR